MTLEKAIKLLSSKQVWETRNPRTGGNVKHFVHLQVGELKSIVKLLNRLKVLEKVLKDNIFISILDKDDKNKVIFVNAKREKVLSNTEYNVLKEFYELPNTNLKKRKED